MAGAQLACSDERGFRAACAAVRRAGVDFANELADMRQSRRLAHAEYLRLAMRHRYCVVARGDFPSTHKITEALALGGSGGCIPLYVAPRVAGVVEGGGQASERRIRPSRFLPYTSWLNYCDVAYFVPEDVARSNMEAVVRELLQRPEAESQAKLRALALVRDAFVLRRSSTVEQPSAAHFILDEMCGQAAARRSRPETASVNTHDDVGACTLFGAT